MIKNLGFKANIILLEVYIIVYNRGLRLIRNSYSKQKTYWQLISPFHVLLLSLQKHAESTSVKMISLC